MVQINCIVATGYTNGVIFLIIVFVDFKSGGHCWTKTAPYLYLALIWISYLLLPWFNFTFLLYTLYDGSLTTKQDYYIWELWCIGCNVIFLTNLVEYIVLVHPTIVYQLLAFAQIREKVEVYRGVKSNAEIADLIGEKMDIASKEDKYLLGCIQNTYGNKNLDYINKKRGYGEGEIRIGNPVDVNSDVYALCINSMLTRDHIMHFVDPLTGEIVELEDKLSFIEYNSIKNKDAYEEIAEAKRLEEESQREEEETKEQLRICKFKAIKHQLPYT